MLGAGVTATASIEVQLHLKKTAAWNGMQQSLRDLKARLNDIARTVGIEKAGSSFAKLQKELDKTKAELDGLKRSATGADAAISGLTEEQAEFVAKLKPSAIGMKGVVQGLDEMRRTTHFVADGLDGLEERASAARRTMSSMDEPIEEVNKALRAEDDYLDALIRSQQDADKRALGYAKSNAKLEESLRGIARAAKLAESAREKKQWESDFRDAVARSTAATREAAKATRDRESAERKRLKAVRDQERADAKAAAAAMKKAAADKKAEEAEKMRERSLKHLVFRINHYERAMDAVFRASFRLKMAGNDMMFFARRVFDSFKQVMDQFGEFEFMMNRAAGALSVPDEMAKELQDSLLDLTVDMRLFPAKDVAEGLYFWGSTTGDVIDSTADLQRNMKALNTVMKVAAMTNTGYEATIKGVYSILSQYFNGAIGMTTQVTEQLFYITQRTAAELPDLINSFKMVGPIAKANNVTFTDMVNLFGRLADLGVRGTMAGRAIRQMFIQMVRPSGPAVKAINRLFEIASRTVKEFQGKSYTELMFPEGEFVGIEGYLTNLARATETLEQAERNAFLAKIATANELPVLTALVNDHIRALNDQTSSTKGVVDASQEASKYFEDNWKKLSESWKGTVGALTSTWEALKMQFASILSDVLRPFIDTIKQLVEGVRQWARDPANRSLIEFLSKLAIGAAAVTGLTGAITVLAGTMIGLGGAAVVLIRSFRPFIPVLGAIATGVLAFADAFIRNFNEIQDAVIYAMDKINGAMDDGSDAFSNLNDTMNDLLDPLHGLMDLMVDVATTAIRLFGDLAAAAIELNKSVPVFKGIATFLGAIAAGRILSGLLALSKAVSLMSLRLLFGATAFKAFSAGMTMAGAARAASGLGIISTAIKGVTLSVAALKAAIGPGGIITLIIAGGFVAYELIPQFKDFIDSITDRFRDLKKEIKEISSEFGSEGGGIAQLAGNYAKSMSDAIASGFDISLLGKEIDELSERQIAENAASPNWVVRYLDTVIFNGGTLQQAKDSVSRKTSEVLDKLAIDVMKEWSALVNDVNVQISELVVGGQQYTTEDAAKILRAFFPIMPSLAAESNRRLVVTEIMKGLAIGGVGRDNVRAIYESLAEKVAEIRDIGFERFLELLGTQESAAQMELARKNKVYSDFYAPYIKAIDDAIGKGITDEELSEMLTKPLMRSIGWSGVKIADISLSEIDWSRMSPELAAIWEAALGILGKETAEDLAGEDLTSILDQTWRPIQEQISAAVRQTLDETMLEAMSVIGDDVRYIANTLPTVTLGTGAMALGERIKNITLTVVENKLKLPDYMRESLLEAANLVLRYGGLTPSDITALNKAFAEEGEDAGEQVVRSWSELVDAFTSALDKRKSLADALKEALKRGSNVKQMRELLSVFVGKDLRKALGGNLQARALGLDVINSTLDGVMAGMQALKGPKRRKMMLQVARFFSFNAKEMPKTARNQWNPIIEWILENAKNLPPRLERRLKRLVGQAVQNGVSEGVVMPPSSVPPLPPDYWNGVIGSIPPIPSDLLTAVGENKPEASFTLDIPITPNVTISSEKITTSVNTAVSASAYGIDTTPVQSALKIDAAPIGNSVLSSYASGMEGTYLDEAKTRVQTSALAIVGALNNETVIQAAIDAGTYVLSTFAGGVLDEAGYAVSEEGSIWKAANKVKNKLNSLNLYTEGGNVGESWTGGITDAIWNLANPTTDAGADLESALQAVADRIAGQSPPKKGPLRTIDRGGRNVGLAWGRGLIEGALRETDMGIQTIRRRMDRGFAGDMSMEHTVSRRKQIDININLNGGNSDMSRENMAEIRRGVMDALVLADLEHMVTIS